MNDIKFENTPFPQDWSAARECLGPEGMLSVVMPAYNLGGVIFDNLRRCAEYLKGNIPFELIPVDDGSADATAAELRRAAREFPCVRPVFLARNEGKGAALRAGADAARGSHILLLDADLDLSPAPLPRFFATMRESGADIVIGSKMHPESEIDYPLRRRIASRVYYGLVKLLVGLPVRDTQTGMKLFRAEALRLAFDRMLAKRFAFDLEVLAIARNAGYRIVEAPIALHFGEKMGSLTARNVRETLNDTLAVFYRLRILRYYDRLLPLPTPECWPSVSVVIACPGDSAMLRDCLAGIAAQEYPGKLEVIVLPDEAPENTPLSLRDIPPQRGGQGGRHRDIHLQGEGEGGRLRDISSQGEGEGGRHRDIPPQSGQIDCSGPLLEGAVGGADWGCRVLPTGRVRPAEKRNLGIRAARGEVVAFLDDDAVPLPGWLQRAARYFANHPDVAAVGGPAITPLGSPWLARLSGRVYACRLVSGGYRRRYEPGLVCREEDLPSCNLLVRTNVLRELGGFDTRHWPGEDTLLCQSITHDLGRTMMYDPWVMATHRRRPLFGPHLRQIGRYALHRGVFARRFPATSRKPAYFMPTLLLAGIVLGAPLAAVAPALGVPWLRWVYLGCLGAYLALVLVFTISLRHPIDWILTAAGVVATHLWYGARFLAGLCGGRLPSDVRPFDHQGA